MTRVPRIATSAPYRAALACAAMVAAACGRSANQSAGTGADSAIAPGAVPGAAVGENKPAKDSAYAGAKQRLDSLGKAGVGPANGIDSVGSKVQAQTANEPIRDTSHLNNRATPPGQRAPTQRP